MVDQRIYEINLVRGYRPGSKEVRKGGFGGLTIKSN
jgi:hypothetical protein